MSADALDILLIQDNPGDARLIEEMLRDAEDLRKRVNLDAMGASAPGPITKHSFRPVSNGSPGPT